jgi:hypothetical protein
MAPLERDAPDWLVKGAALDEMHVVNAQKLTEVAGGSGPSDHTDHVHMSLL